jgi:WD40 repeat protein
VRTAAFSPDGRRVITRSDDESARLWDVRTGEPISESLDGHDGPVLSAAFSPDGRHIVTGSSHRTARIWNILPDTQSLVLWAKSTVPRCLTAAQRATFFLPPEPPVWCIEMAKWPYDTAEWKQWLADKRDGKNPPLPAEQ